MLVNIQREISRQKWKLIKQLKSVYSITQANTLPSKSKLTDSFLHSSNSSPKEPPQSQAQGQGSFISNVAPSLAINGISLPNSDFTGCDEEQIATALGYVAHLVIMISKYLEVPLRYPMLPMCSRSIVRDDISHQISPKYLHSLWCSHHVQVSIVFKRS